MREKISNPASAIYAFVHFLVFLTGVIILQIDLDYEKYKPIFDAVGASLIAASIAGAFLYYYIRYADEIRVKVQMMLHLGLHQAFDIRGVNKRDEYKDRFKNAKKNIDIMGYGLNTFLEEHRDDFEAWQAKCNVRILLIDPDYPKESPYSFQRDKEENKSNGTIKGEVVRFVEASEEVIKNKPLRPKGSFEVKLYRALPNITVCRIDDEILWGPYFVKTLSRDTPVFIVKKGGRIYDQVLDQFEAIWDSDNLSHTPDSLNQ